MNEPINNQIPPSCPYKGLQPYTEEDRAYFFGRERDREIIISNLYAAPLTVLYGASGVGKSSVLLAGVVPALRETPRVAVVVFRNWQNANFTLELKKEVLRAIMLNKRMAPRASVSGASPTFEASAGMPDIDVQLPFDEFLGQCAQILRGQIFFILDQFEEYFLYHHAPGIGQDGFEAEFARAVNRLDIRANFLLSMREDGLSKLDRFQGRIPNLMGNLLRLEHLDRVAAQDAIRKPLAEYNRHLLSEQTPVSIENDLVEVLLVEVETDKVMLDQLGQGKVNPQSDASQHVIRIETPLLQMVLMRLWEVEIKSGSRCLRLSTLTRLGGTKTIVRTHLDEEMEELDEPERDAAARMFRFLVNPSGMKIAQEPGALADWAELPEAQARLVLERLSGKRRVLRMVTASGQPDRYEIFHDILAPAVLDWRARYVQARTRAEAEKRLAKEQARLAKERRRVKRLRVGVAGLVLLLVGMVALAIYAQKKRRDAQTAQTNGQSREIAARALSQLDFDPELSVLLAKEAVMIAKTDQAKYALRKSLIESRVRFALRGHKEEVLVAAFSPNGKLVVTASSDQARIWDANNGQELQLLQCKEPVLDASFVPQQEHLVIVASGAAVRVWDLQERNWKQNTLIHDGTVKNAVFSPDGKLLLTASDRETAIWRTSDWLQSVRMPACDSAAFSGDGKLVVTVSEIPENSENTTKAAKTVCIRDAATGHLLGRPVEHPDNVNSAAFSPDGKVLLTAGDDYTAQLWQVGTGKSSFQMKGHTGSVTKAIFSPPDERNPDRMLLATVSRDNTVRIWDAKSGSQRAELRGHSAEITSATFSSNGKYLVTASFDGVVALWEARTGEHLGSLMGHSGKVNSVVFSPDNRFVLTASADKTARIWDAAAWLASDELSEHQQTVNRVAFSSDDKWLVTASADRSSRVWDADALFKSLEENSRNEKMKSFQILNHKGEVTSVAFSPDGKLVATACEYPAVTLDGLPSGKIHVWAVNSGGEGWSEKTSSTRPIVSKSRVTNAFFSPNGRNILATSEEGLKIWDLEKGDSDASRTMQLMSQSPEEAIYLKTASWSPDGKLLLVATQTGEVVFWDAAGGINQLAPYKSAELKGPLSILESATKNKMSYLSSHTKAVNSIFFSSLGDLFVTASEDQTARVWETNGWRSKAVLRGHSNVVLYAFFSPFDELVVTASEDKTARLWDLNTGLSLITLHGHTQGVTSATFSHSGRFIVTTGKDYTVRIHRCEECGRTGDLLALVAKRTTRELTKEEQENFLPEGHDR